MLIGHYQTISNGNQQRRNAWKQRAHMTHAVHLQALTYLLSYKCSNGAGDD